MSIIKFLIVAVNISGLFICSVSQAELWVKFNITSKAVEQTIQGDGYKLGITDLNNTNIKPNYILATQAEYTDARQAFKKVDTAQPTGLRVISMSQPEIDTITAARDAALDLALRDGAKNPYTDLTSTGLMVRALADIIKDEINILRAQHGLSDRTLAQLKTAIQNRIDSGGID